MDGMTDEQLVDFFRESSEIHYFDALVGRYVAKIRGLVYSMVLNHADADELTQDVFVRVVNGIGGFKSQAKFSSWLYRIALNTTRSFLGKRARSPIEHRDRIPERADHAASPAERLDLRKTQDDVARALAALSPALRAAITLTVLQGLSVKDAAAAEGCLTTTMYWRVHEARTQMGKALEAP
jgi:RNA polymerase sigma-70 factor, ECF subfamily